MTNVAAFNSRKQLKGRMGREKKTKFIEIRSNAYYHHLSLTAAAFDSKSKNSQQFCDPTHSRLLVLSVTNETLFGEKTHSLSTTQQCLYMLPINPK
ncbi:hypothetical protein MtrunA17_Chr7g0253241 [Medicago truncatula]|uniref:Uncharacterized protein n=1 Tax=Medicago truncatula TaxID=3880 RepID=A0A396H2A1_MEDTR|nr:hypothetical protein MtrunA17_Chr7g0253241 [Medicago truncatula]